MIVFFLIFYSMIYSKNTDDVINVDTLLEQATQMETIEENRSRIQNNIDEILNDLSQQSAVERLPQLKRVLAIFVNYYIQSGNTHIRILEEAKWVHEQLLNNMEVNNPHLIHYAIDVLKRGAESI